MRYIDADALLKEQFCGNLPVVAVDDIKAMPTADVAPVRRARWKSHIFSRPPRAYEMATCSECLKVFSEYSDWWKWKFCPHCGANMEADAP